MTRFWKVLGWILLSVVGAVTVLLIIGWFVDSRESDEALNELFQNQTIKPTIHRYTVQEPGERPRTIRFMETPARRIRTGQGVRGDSALPVVLFIHGAPSSLSFFDKFFTDTTLLNRAQLVAVDRPGYGYSDFGRVETSIVKQAKLLQPLIDRYNKAPFLMLVGSSYGGSVSARLAMNNPNRVNHVVFVSSSLGPGLERTYGISYFADSPLIHWLVPPLLRLANDEKLAHRKALEAILPDWPNIRAGITMLHGQKDELIYPANVSFAQQHLVNAQFKQFILPESRHDIVYNRREYITDILLNILSSQPVRQVVKVQPMASR